MNRRLILCGRFTMLATLGVALAVWPAASAVAVNSTWQGDFDDSWHNSTNWTAGEPGVGDTAFFTTVAAGDSTTPRVFFPVVTAIGAIDFQAGAPAFTLTVDHTPNPGAVFQISGAGITNNSAQIQSIFIAGDVSLDQAGELVFLNNATAGDNLLITNGTTFLAGGSGGVTSFEDNSTAGGATIVNQSEGISGGAIGGVTHFRDNANAASATITNLGAAEMDTMTRFDNNSSAGSAHITNEGAAEPPNFCCLIGRGLTLFVGSSDAGAAEITNMGATGVDAAVGATGFRDNASAGNATIINQGGVNNGLGGETIFSESATAGTAMITTSGGSFGNPGGRTVFTESSTAANAQLITNGGFLGGGGRTSFTGNASGGEAVVITNAGGEFDISGLTTNGTTVGSIAGLGSYVLGAKNLTVGTGFAGAFADTEVSGVISGADGSLNKTGNGALTLSGVNTYTGGTILDAGRLSVDNDAALGAGTLQIFGGILGSHVAGTVIPNNISVSGDFAVSPPPGFFAQLELAGDVNLGAVTHVIRPDSGNFANFSGRLLGTIAGVSFSSPTSVDGAFVLSGSDDNAYGGTTTVQGNLLSGGTVDLVLAKSGGATAIPGDLVINLGGGVSLIEDEQIADAAEVTVNLFGDFDVEGHTETITALNGNGSVHLDSTTTGGVLVVLVGDFNGMISDAGLDGQLVKPGPGTLFLSGASTYTGGTRVEGGILAVDNTAGSATGAGPVIVRPDAVLAGGNTAGTAGFIAGAVSIQDMGHLEPGGSPGTLTLQDDLSLAPMSQLEYDLGQPGAEGGGDNDLVKVLGDLVLDGVLNVSPIGFGGTGDYTLLTYDGALADNGLSIGLIPTGYSTNQFIIDVSVPAKVILRVVPESSSLVAMLLGAVIVTLTSFERHRFLAG